MSDSTKEKVEALEAQCGLLCEQLAEQRRRAEEATSRLEISTEWWQEREAASNRTIQGQADEILALRKQLETRRRKSHLLDLAEESALQPPVFGGEWHRAEVEELKLQLSSKEQDLDWARAELKRWKVEAQQAKEQAENAEERLEKEQAKNAMEALRQGEQGGTGESKDHVATESENTQLWRRIEQLQREIVEWRKLLKEFEAKKAAKEDASRGMGFFCCQSRATLAAVPAPRTVPALQGVRPSSASPSSPLFRGSDYARGAADASSSSGLRQGGRI